MRILSKPTFLGEIFAILLFGLSLACGEKSDETATTATSAQPAKVSDSAAKTKPSTDPKSGNSAQVENNSEDASKKADASDDLVNSSKQATIASEPKAETKPTPPGSLPASTKPMPPATPAIDPAITQAACDSGLTAAQIIAFAQAPTPPAASGLSAAQFAQIKAALVGVTEAQVQTILDSCPP